MTWKTTTLGRTAITCALLVAAQLAGTRGARAELSVVATTADYGALASTVGGENVSVKVLAKPTEDPHFVDARPSHVVKLNRADVLIESGCDLELGWLGPLVTGSRNKNMLLGARGRVLGSTGIRLLDVPTTLDRSQGDLHAKGNPHFLMDPGNAIVVAQQLAQVFCRLDPASCPKYEGNLGGFKTRLEENTRIWDGKLASHRGKSIVTYHNTWRYFASRFGLKADLFLEPKPGIPPSPRQLAEVIQRMNSEGLKIILLEPFQSSKTAAVVAGRVGGEVVEVCQFPGGIPGTDGDYIALMDANVDAIAKALSAHSAR